jgi:hypothetical protein
MEASHMPSVIALSGRLKLLEIARLDGEGGYEFSTLPRILETMSPTPTEAKSLRVHW